MQPRFVAGISSSLPSRGYERRAARGCRRRPWLTYRDALSPAWNSQAYDTAIDRTTFNGKLEDYRFALTNLTNALRQAAGQTSNWSGVTDDDGKKPDDNADVTGDNTSKDTANVNGRSAAQLIEDMDVNTASILAAALRQEEYEQVTGARTFINGQPIDSYVMEFRNQQTAANSAISSTLNLIGAKTSDGTGWVLNLNTVQVGNGQTLGQRLDEVGVANGTVTASITQLQEVTADLRGKVNTSVTLNLTSNGYVSGYRLTNDGTVSAMVVLADQFAVVSDNNGTPIIPFRIAGGTVYMDRLVAGSITYDALVQRFTDVGQQNLNPSGWYQVFPGGMIMQGGRYRGTVNDEVTVAITFPRPFPNQVLAIGAMPFLTSFRNTRDLWMQNVGEPSTSGATFATQAATKNDQRLDGFDWWAWGR